MFSVREEVAGSAGKKIKMFEFNKNKDDCKCVCAASGRFFSGCQEKKTDKVFDTYDFKMHVWI